jgi:iron complex outermembrane recepter protein
MNVLNRVRTLAVVPLLLIPFGAASAQGAAQTGSVAGKVTDDKGAAVAGAQVGIQGTTIGVQTSATGDYVLGRVPVGTQTVRVRMVGFRPDSASVTVAADQRASQDFTLQRNPLQLQTLVVTGTQTPRLNLDASVAVTSLTPQDIQRAAPRSTTEFLRYVPGFTRVESSGGEVNQNITMRGILSQEYVMFMEDGMPVYPQMHTFFMNADNLFREDENIQGVEVVRGGASALFGSNTPGAIINFINKTGGDQFAGTMRATGGTKGLARYDANVGGPLGDDWRFSVGGFYRYDHGVRDPGYPGTRGGQLKANVTRLLRNGYLRVSAKYLDDRNQFILDLPFQNRDNPEFVPGFGDYGSMNTNEGLGLRVPTPTGDLSLGLDNGFRTQATWFTADASFDVAEGWHLQNTAQFMQDNQEANAIVPSTAIPADQYATTAPGQTGLGLPAGTTLQITYTNHFTATAVPVPEPFSTPNNLLAPGEQWHIIKPISAVQDNLQVRRSIGPHTISAGAYFANYSQENHWNISQILTDVRDNPRYLDVVATPPGGTPIQITKNGFRNYLSSYVNGDGQTSIFSGVLGAEVQLTPKFRADLGGRVEYDKFVQSAENTSTFDLDGDPTTGFDNEKFGNGSFRHFEKSITDWAGSLGLIYKLRDNISVYASGSRGYKMPALDEFLNPTSDQAVALFDAQQVEAVEGGFKGIVGPLGFTVNGFWTKKKNVTSQGSVVDTLTGGTTWIVVNSPENKAYGAEIEAVVTPVEGLQVLGSSTILKAELGTGAGADIGSRIAGVPTSLSNLAAVYSVPRTGFQLKVDWHWVDKRPVDVKAGVTLPSYNYFNFGAGYTIPGQGTTISLDLLNAFQSKGLEEGNPRLVSTTGLFLARPLLPRRLQASVRYDFGGAPRQQQ